MKPLVLALLTLVACGPDAEGRGDPIALEIAPTEATLAVIDGVRPAQPFTASVRYADGTTEEVTALTSFSFAPGYLAGFEAPGVLVASGAAGGRGDVVAALDDFRVTAAVEVFVSNRRVLSPAPDNAADLFAAAVESPSLSPLIRYPSEQVLLPRNVGDFEVHWTDLSDSSNLYEVRLASEWVDMRVYLRWPNPDAWTAFLPDEWAVLRASSNRTATVEVRGMNLSVPEVAGTSRELTVYLADEDVRGGLYYWASYGSASGDDPGIYRHDMALPGQPAEKFLTFSQLGGECVGCHGLSRDGTRMAVTRGGGNGWGEVVDVASGEMVFDTPPRWSFAAFAPDNQRLIAAFDNELTLRAADTGALIATVPTEGLATEPEFSPTGDAIAWVRIGSPDMDWDFAGGRIFVQPFDPDTETFGEPRELVGGAGNFYFPTWSPDGQWILYTHSQARSYNAPSAEIWVVRADGSAPPIRLDVLNGGLAEQLTNSWARWAPFEHQQGDPAEPGNPAEPLYWLTFSSQREFGIRLKGVPQIWMSAFYPSRAAGGGDPSTPPFRLPFQNLTTNNHNTQWVEEIVDIQ